jgi:Predicted periplasmic ligand-binding sensor domain
MHYGLSAGLASNEVNTVAQDEAGYIWIGTANGLQRFDGLRYKSFRANKKILQPFPAILFIKYYLIRNKTYG